MSGDIYDEEVSAEIEELYNQMFDEIKAEVDELDGTLDAFEPESKLISVSVDPDVQEYMQTIIAEIVAKYEQKRKDILEKDAFCGVKLILRDTDN